MLTLRLAPRRGAALRAAWASGEITGVLVLGHAWAGGALPSATWIALMALTVFGAGVLVLQKDLAMRYAVPGLVATQLLLHGWLTALSTGGHGAHAGHSHTALDPRMLAVHVGAAMVTALVWHLRARATEIVLAWSKPDRLPVVGTVRDAAHGVLAAVHVRLVVTDAPRRGPPWALCLTPA